MFTRQSWISKCHFPIFRSSHEAFLDDEEDFKHLHQIRILADFYTFPKTNFCINFNYNFLSHLLSYETFVYHFHKIQTKIFHIIISDWVKNFWKWSQIALKKKRFLPILVRRQKSKKLFFSNAICDHLQISLTLSGTILWKNIVWILWKW